MARIRDPAVAGMFYPKRKEELIALLEELHNHAEKYVKKYKELIKAVIAPHAGYIYSGIVASATYQTLKANSAIKNHYTLIGPSHYFGFYDVAGSTYEMWRTPLGLVPVQNLLDLPPFDNAFAHEHSLEVQLPFLQYYFNEFSIFPVLTGKITNIKNIADKFNSIIANTTFIVSSDLSHYYPYDTAVQIDENTINHILNLDLEGFEKEGNACGKEGIKIILKLAIENNWEPDLILYQNSGDTSGSKENVVGYAGIVFLQK
ncbi:MAG: AmmeMemoRadiSam system protein B [Candidatus Nanohaloarchaeota archaeon]|nr:AmmeMemoRadiSam system protein B [Candidatus Nanohaloarchaeota archaeon]